MKLCGSWGVLAVGSVMAVGASLPVVVAADGGSIGVPDYVGGLGQYVNPPSRRDANNGYGASFVAGFDLNSQVSAEVRAFGAGLDRQPDGTPFIVGAGGAIRASERHGFFITGGAGAERGSVDHSHRVSPYVEVGAGYQHPLFRNIALRLEGSYRLLTNLGSEDGRGGFGGELWAGAGFVFDFSDRRHGAAAHGEAVQVIPVQCPPTPEGLLVGDNGVLVPQDSRSVAIGFATNSATLDEAAQAEVAQLAAALRCGTAQQLAVQLIGHADERGNALYNVKLSERRADAVRSGLITAGVEPDRIAVDGEGKYQPLEKGRNPSIYAANRRIQITLYPGIKPE